jgi:hypothetical protein
MKKPCLITWAITAALLFSPWHAFAATCWQDPEGFLYSIEFGTASGTQLPIFGSVNIPPCVPAAGNIVPLFGAAVMVNPATMVIGWHVLSLDLAAGCVSFRGRYTLDVGTSVLTGEWMNDDLSASGSDQLTPTPCASTPLSSGAPNGPDQPQSAGAMSRKARIP